MNSTDTEKIARDLTVFVSEDYKLFKLMKGNRFVSKLKVDKLVRSINKGLNILKYCPILVNKKFEIIDGQHRFQACKQLRQPVYYIKVNDFELREVAEMNSNSDKWKPKDFLNCYINLGNEHYKYLANYIELQNMPLNVAVSLLMGGGVSEGGRFVDQFKDGSFQVIHKEFAQTVANHLRSFSPLFGKANSRNFISAIITLIKSQTYDHVKMMEKANKHKDRFVEKETRKEYLVMLEDIFNVNAQTRKRIY